jgi:tryptophan synthase beta chain
MHQTVIGLEAQEQMKLAGEYPDVVIACHGGGSNFSGIAMPFARDKLNGKKVRLLAAEPTSCPTLTKGVYAFDYGDTVGVTPIVKMHTLGHDFMPPGIHAGGLRYHGAAPLVSKLLDEGLIEAGHGHFDLAAYDQYLAGKLEDFEYPREAVERSMANLPVVEV